MVYILARLAVSPSVYDESGVRVGCAVGKFFCTV
jgi:hypothetical protein